VSAFVHRTLTKNMGDRHRLQAWLRRGGGVLPWVLGAAGGGCAEQLGYPAILDDRSDSLALELDIGSAMGRGPEYEFGEILAVLATANGKIWVIDGVYANGTMQRPQLRVFDSAGRFLYRAGGAGDGPGEYRAPYALAELKDGRVAVRDNTLPERVVLYGADGRHNTTWILPAGVRWVPGAGHGIEVDTGGIVWLARRIARPGPERPPVSFVRMRPDGTVLDEIPGPVLERAKRRAGPLERSQASVAAIAAPYEPQPVWAWIRSGGFATASTGRYRIEIQVVDPKGTRQPPHVITRTVRKPALHAEEREALRQRMEDKRERAGPANHITVPAVPTHKTPLAGVIVSADDGRLLVFANAESRRVGHYWVDEPRIDLFDQDGTYRQTLILPPAFDVSQMVGDHVLGVFRTPEGVQSVRRYKVRSHGGREAPSPLYIPEGR
jgi:hypothetical protein